jgi:hypothetical protein
LNSESYKTICYILLALLVYSVFSHYNTGRNYTETCSSIFSAVNHDETRFEQVLGKRLSSECRGRMAYSD